jgi:isopentenyldiphosphate isomerase
MEELDVLNEKGEKTGEVITSKEAHEKGVTHRSVHIWILNPDKQLLLQKRSANMRARPGYWDISASGHMSAGETSIEAAQKETREELGLDLPSTAFVLLFTVQEHVVLNEGTYIANEFQDVYLVRLNSRNIPLFLQSEEVEDTRWIDIDEFKIWTQGKGELLVPHSEEHQRLLQYLEAKF